MNRLQYELSPYLNTHAADSVDWYPWGPEVFERAQAEHRPLLIAIGTAVHNPEFGTTGTVARITRRYFVPVQVDAREFPDVAAYYIRAARILMGGLSAPLEVLADAGGRPFFASRPLREVELAGLLSGVALQWHSDPTGYQRTAELVDAQAGQWQPAKTDGEDTTAQRHFARLQKHYDSTYGGFGTGAKLLLPQELLFLMAYAKHTGQAYPMEMAVFTLQRMAEGGVRDHIAGGFFHSARDRAWQEPVPEKRLLDQAWLLDCYVTAYAATGIEDFARVAREIADFVLRELRHVSGGFYTTQWSREGYYDMERSAFEMAGEVSHDLRMELYRQRLERGRPELEETVLVGQNGVMIAALCKAGRILGSRRYLTAAVCAEDFLRRRLVGLTDLRRYWCYGAAAGEGALEDYAGYALGQLELYRAGCGGEHLRCAAKVMARADALFSHGEQGGYYLHRGQSHLPCRPKQLWDEGVPSGWSVAVRVLWDLAKELRHPAICRRAAQLREQLGENCAYGLIAWL